MKEMEKTYLDVRGAKTELMRRGSGAPLVYLHSAGGAYWGPFLDALSERFTVLAPTLPGFGGSEGLDRIDTIEDLVFHTVDLLDVLGLDRVAVAGLSLGGWLAAELAVHHPHRVSRLVLIDAVGLKVEGAPIADLFLADPDEARRLLFGDPESEIARQIVPDDPPDDVLAEVLKSREASARIGWNPYFHDPKLRSRLYRVQAPTLVVWGEDDKLVSEAHADAYVAGIAGARKAIVPGTGHAPSLEKPRETAKIVLEFLGG